MYCRAISERIAERHAEFDDVGAGFGKSEDEFVRGDERRIARGNVGHKAELARFAEGGKTFRDASRLGGYGSHEIFARSKA